MSEADLDAVGAFHAGLSFPDTSGLGDIGGSVFILHAGSDPHVPQQDLNAIWEAVEAAGVEYQINIYGSAVHSFTNPRLGDHPSQGVDYDETGAGRFWAEMQTLSDNIF